MSENAYQPAKVWTWDPEAKGNGAKTNRPFAGPTH
ncbi:MAG: glutathione-dependent disulfide-bond oxidoreductase, partial [Pantoea agglomerans]